jgi:hypothetical protein
MAARREHRNKVTRKAGAAITKRRFVKYGSGDEIVIQAAASTDLIIGVSDDAGDVSTDGRIDVIDEGYVLVDCGGTVTRGQHVMSDSSGRAITAAASAGVNVYTGGQAHSSGVLGGVISVKVSPGIFQGAT